jgi:hypothetical protein
VGPSPDETETIDLLPLEPKELDGFIRDGTIWDGMTIAAWSLAMPRLLNPADR